MRRLFFTLLLPLMGVLTMRANPVDPSLARTAALKFFEARTNVENLKGTLEMAYTGPDNAFYVFTAGTKGFVIIAGDDAHRPVIGYSDES